MRRWPGLGAFSCPGRPDSILAPPQHGLGRPEAYFALLGDAIRVPAVSKANYPALLELQKIRHFRRYHFEMEYDWDRLDFILKKLEAAHPVAIVDLSRFSAFLRSL